MRFKHRKRVRKKRLQTRQDRILTLANAISISSIFLAIPLVLIFEDIANGMNLNFNNVPMEIGELELNGSTKFKNLNKPR